MSACDSTAHTGGPFDVYFACLAHAGRCMVASCMRGCVRACVQAAGVGPTGAPASDRCLEHALLMEQLQQAKHAQAKLVVRLKGWGSHLYGGRLKSTHERPAQPKQCVAQRISLMSEWAVGLRTRTTNCDCKGGTQCGRCAAHTQASLGRRLFPCTQALMESPCGSSSMKVPHLRSTSQQPARLARFKSSATA